MASVNGSRVLVLLVAAWPAAACVPAGSAGMQDAGASTQPARPVPLPSPVATAASAAPVAVQPEAMKAPFFDDFDHPPAPSPSAAALVGVGVGVGVGPVALVAPGAEAGEAGPVAGWVEPSHEWMTTAPGIWRIEGGRLCGEHAKNHGIWLRRVLPTNARIEFDATSLSPDGDLKAEAWGDGRSYATALSYTNATSYLTIFGGWHNKFHVLARINEHGNDRKEITIDPSSDDPREKPVVAGQSYHFKIERSDGKTVRWWVDGNEMLSYPDPSPLMAAGHDHFGFNDWEVKVCFDNVRVVPLP